MQTNSMLMEKALPEQAEVFPHLAFFCVNRFRFLGSLALADTRSAYPASIASELEQRVRLVSRQVVGVLGKTL